MSHKEPRNLREALVEAERAINRAFEALPDEEQPTSDELPAALRYVRYARRCIGDVCPKCNAQSPEPGRQRCSDCIADADPASPHYHYTCTRCPHGMPLGHCPVAECDAAAMEAASREYTECMSARWDVPREEAKATTAP